MNVTFGAYYTLIMAVLVLMLGKLMTRHIRFLRDFNIPEPVSGGLVVAAIIFMLHQTTGLALSFEGSLQSAFMLVFFSSIGLSANFAKLREGGSALFLFLGVIAVFIIMQNIVGVSLASVLGLDPLIGLVAGSITLVGGHGTAGAWGSVLENQYGLTGATTLGIACATFGLVIGGLVGGPLAKRLITRHQLAQPLTDSEQLRADAPTVSEGSAVANFESPNKAPRLITADAAVETALARVDMLDYRHRQIGELSGGQKKRVFLARAIAQDGQVILLDEPFTGVDVKTEARIIDLLRELRDEGRTMLVSTHNLGSVTEFCDYTVMIKGTVLASGPTDTTFTPENLELAFSGVLRHVALSGGEQHVITDDERPFISRRAASEGE